MSMVTLGDLSTHFLLRRHNTALRAEIGRMGQELATGRVSDPAAHLRGDLGALAEIEWRQMLTAGYRQAARETMLVTDAMQAALDVVQTQSDVLAAAARAGALMQTDLLPSITARSGREALEMVVSALNTQAAGRHVFSGDTSDRPALAAADTMLADLRLATAGLTSAADVAAAVTDWFMAPGGGFETLAHSGSSTPAPPLVVAEGERVSLAITADQSAFRALMIPMALVALADDPGLVLDPAQRRDLLASAATAMHAAQPALIELRADLGVTEERLEDTSARLASRDAALDVARDALLGIDPYQAATRLEEARFNLESLYTITARMSRLRLSEYL